MKRWVSFCCLNHLTLAAPRRDVKERGLSAEGLKLLLLLKLSLATGELKTNFVLHSPATAQGRMAQEEPVWCSCGSGMGFFGRRWQHSQL